MPRQPRRARGSVRERPAGSGRWQVIVSLPRGDDGKVQQVTRMVTGTYKEADAERVRLLERYQDANKRLATRATLGDLMQRWLDDITFEGRSHSHIYGSRLKVEKVKADRIGQIRLTKLSVSDLTDYYRRLSDSGLAPATVRRYHAAVSAALAHAEALEWVPAGRNPARAAKKPKSAKKEIVPPPAPHVQRLIADAWSDPILGMFVQLAATTGARDGELCALRESDLLFVSNEIVFNKALSDTPGRGVTVGETKGRNTRRVPVSQATMDVLFTHLARLRDRATEAGVELDPNPWLFSYEADASKPISPNAACKYFATLRDTINQAEEKKAKEAGVPVTLRIVCTLHHLRHFFASQLLAAGRPITEVSTLLGHQSTRMTLDVYGHFIPTNTSASADVMGRLLGLDA